MITSTINSFSPELVLAMLSIVFGLAYRRLLGLKHIWHWRGLLVVGLGLLAGSAIAIFGLEHIEMWMESVQRFG